MARSPQVADTSMAGIINLVLERLNAPTSKVAYARALREFLAWYQIQPSARFDKATVQRYRARLVDAGLAPSTINQRHRHEERSLYSLTLS